MNPKPISEVLEGEHLLATWPTLAPEVYAGWHRRLNFWTGRALTADALENEQDHRSGHLAARGGIITPGVVSGLGVSLRSGGANLDTVTLSGSPLLSVRDLRDPISLATKLAKPEDLVSEFLRARLSAGTRELLGESDKVPRLSEALLTGLVTDLNAVVQGASIWDEARFAHVLVRPDVRELQRQSTDTTDFSRLNRLLLEDTYPTALMKMALAGAIIHVDPGLGLTATGEQVVVPRLLDLDLNEVAWLFLDDEGKPRPFNEDDLEELFTPSEQILAEIPKPWAAVLLLQPANVTLIERRGENDPCELDEDADAFADPRRVECLRFRLCVLPSTFLPEPIGAGVVNHNPSWRNRVAYHLFQREAARARQMSTNALPSAGEAAPWEQLGVALGLVSFEPDPANPTQLRLFLDRTSVVRSAGWPRPRPRPRLAIAPGAAPLWKARIRQFAEHVSDLPLRDSPDATVVSRHFQFLPPAGLLPRSALSLLTTAQARLFAAPTLAAPSDRAGTSRFFPAHWIVEAAPLPVDELDAALAASAPLAAFDLTSADVDHVRMLVPVSRSDFEPELLVVAEPDARVEAELKRLVGVRQDWLWRRVTVRERYGAHAQLISGKPSEFPTPANDPARIDDSEKNTRPSLFPDAVTSPPTVPVLRTPRELREIATIAFSLPAGSIIPAGQAPLLHFHLDREATPEAIRVVFESPDGAAPSRAIVWSNSGVNPRWGTTVDVETRVGLVPEPGEWSRQTTPVPGGESQAIACDQIRFEVFRGHAAVAAALTLGASVIVGVAPDPINRNGWALVPADGVVSGPLEDSYEPVFSDGATLDSRWKEIFDAVKADVVQKKGVAVELVPIKPDGVARANPVGIEEALQLLDAVADQADDFIDVNFTRAQTNLYRIRKFVLGETAAQRLLINPALATIADQETATANAEQLATFFKEAKTREVVDRSDLVEALSPTTAPVGGVRPTVGGRRAIVGLEERSFIASPPPPVNPVFVSRGTIAESRESRDVALDLSKIVKAEESAPIGESAKLKFSAGLNKNVFGIGKKDITAQLPEAGPTLPPRGLTISTRFTEPKASLNLGYARSALGVVLNQLPQLGMRLRGEFVGTADGSSQVELVNLQGFNSDAEGTPVNKSVLTAAELTALGTESPTPEQVRGALVQRMLTVSIPAATDNQKFDEATVTLAALDMTEIKTALLRSIERAVQQRRALLQRGAETLEVLNVKAQEANQRLFVLDAKLAEARHDVNVARALLEEEIERTKRINDRRDSVIAGVSYFAYVRPRMVDPVRRDTPSAPLDRADALPLVPECLQRHDQPPDELAEYIGLFRHSPARWFVDVAPRLKELDTPEKLVRLVESAKSNSARYSEMVVPSEKMRKAPASVSTVYDKRRRALEQKRLKTNLLGIYQPGELSWGQHQELASEHATLGDVIDARHGHAQLAKAAAAMIDQLKEIATCLHAEFAGVTPALRLAWTERLGQFDADTDLRDLSTLPRWPELSRPARQRFQEFGRWLFQQVNNSELEALDLINDLIRLVLLLASHAPVNQLIDGHIPRPTPVFLDALVLVKPFDPGLVRAGMDVVIWDQAKVVARAKVEDLRGADTAIRVSHLGDKVKSVEPKMRVQFVGNGAKVGRIVK
ncbi:MAG TPA: hypothetical protein PLX89_09055 [Verrucomicrobiota bacterium]|nr:hypothetical protein [Verrucomicrobiota bacterium]